MGGGDPSVGVDGEDKVGAGAVGGNGLCLLCPEEGSTSTGEGRLNMEKEIWGGGRAKGGGVGG